MEKQQQKIFDCLNEPEALAKIQAQYYKYYEKILPNLFIKTFLILSFISLGLFSCENEVYDSNDSGINSIDIENLASKIYFDTEFPNVTLKYFEFESKFNSASNLGIFNSLKSDLELYNWIEMNIHKTNFVSISEFNKMKNDYLNLKNTFFNKYQSEIIKVVKSEKNIPLFEERLSLIIESNESNISYKIANDCYESGKKYIRRSQSNATAGLAASAVTAFFNPVIGAAGALATSIYLTKALEACQDAFDACINK